MSIYSCSTYIMQPVYQESWGSSYVKKSSIGYMYTTLLVQRLRATYHENRAHFDKSIEIGIHVA